MLVAYRNLTQERTRPALSIGGVALAMMLILVGFLVGMDRQIASYLENSEGSILPAFF